MDSAFAWSTLCEAATSIGEHVRTIEAPDLYVLTAAAMGGCGTLVMWLVAQHPGCLANPWATFPYTAAARNGERGTLIALRRLGVLFGTQGVAAHVVEQAREGRAVRWLVEHGALVGSREEMDGALGLAVWDYSEEAAAWLRGLAAAGGPAAEGA